MIPGGRRVDPHALEHPGCRRVRVLARTELDVQHRADGVRLTAIDDELQTLSHEIVGFLLEQRLEAEQSLLARQIAPLDDLADDRGSVVRGRAHHPRKDPECVAHDTERRLDADRRDRSDHDDGECGTGDQGHEARALEDRADHDGTDREHEADESE